MNPMTRYWTCIALFLPFTAVFGVHDSLNIILPPGGQECFFEEFAQDSADIEIDIFIPQNGNVDIILKVSFVLFYVVITIST